MSVLLSVSDDENFDFSRLTEAQQLEIVVKRSLRDMQANPAAAAAAADMPPHTLPNVEPVFMKPFSAPRASTHHSNPKDEPQIIHIVIERSSSSHAGQGEVHDAGRFDVSSSINSVRMRRFTSATDFIRDTNRRDSPDSGHVMKDRGGVNVAADISCDESLVGLHSPTQTTPPQQQQQPGSGDDSEGSGLAPARGVVPDKRSTGRRSDGGGDQGQKSPSHSDNDGFAAAATCEQAPQQQGSGIFANIGSVGCMSTSPSAARGRDAAGFPSDVAMELISDCDTMPVLMTPAELQVEAEKGGAREGPATVAPPSVSPSKIISPTSESTLTPLLNGMGTAGSLQTLTCAESGAGAGASGADDCSQTEKTNTEERRDDTPASSKFVHMDYSVDASNWSSESPVSRQPWSEKGTVCVCLLLALAFEHFVCIFAGSSFDGVVWCGLKSQF